MRLSEDEYAALWRTQIAESRQSTPPGWTPDRVETLTRLWNDGLTASVIAARLRHHEQRRRRQGVAPWPCPMADRTPQTKTRPHVPHRTETAASRDKRYARWG